MTSQDKPADCCTGTLHTGTPLGRVETLHNYPCYITDPPDNLPPKAIILIIPDAFGWELPNTRVLADNYAKRLQCQVLLPDLMDGHHLDWNLLDSLNTVTDKTAGFLQKIVPALKVAQSFPLFLHRCRFSLVHPRLTSFLTSLHSTTPSPPPIAAAGFCWGGKFVFALCAGRDTTTPSPGSQPLVACGYAAHPSNLTLPQDAAAVTLPLAVCAGSEDVVFGLGEVEKVRGVFEGKGGGESGFEVRVVEGARHGFAVRGDESKVEEGRYCEEAEDMAVEFLGRWVGRGPGGV